MPREKILSLNELKKTLGRFKRAGRRIVFTNGCFDILHYGHVRLLEDAKRLGDILVVGLNSDSSIRRIKGKARPVRSDKERSRLLAGLEAVDYVTVFSESTPEKIIKILEPDVLVKGGDWHKGNIVGAGFVDSKGGKVVTIPFVKGYSTTALIKKIKKL